MPTEEAGVRHCLVFDKMNDWNNESCALVDVIRAVIAEEITIKPFRVGEAD
jgi:hypothetical protein